MRGFIRALMVVVALAAVRRAFVTRQSDGADAGSSEMPDPELDQVDEASLESFPASDPPQSW